MVYWQTGMLYVDNGRIEFQDLAAIRCDGRIYEQKEYKYCSKCSNLRLATKEEQETYYNELDCKLTWQYCQRIIQRQDLCLDVIRLGKYEKLTRLRLAVNPPEYLYVKVRKAENIFKSAALTMKDNRTSLINWKDCMLNDNTIAIGDKDKTYALDFYDNVDEIREATETERKLLILKMQSKYKEIKKDRMDFGEFLDVKRGTMLYASDGKHYQYIFPDGGHQRIEGSEIIRYQGGCLVLKINGGNFDFHTFTYGTVAHFNSLEVLRKADAEEIKMYNNKKREEEQRKIDIKRREKNTKFMESKMRPFVTKVLVCNGFGDVWKPAIFGCFVESGCPKYMIVGGQRFTYCILYNKYRHLIGRDFDKNFDKEKSEEL